MVYGAKQHDVHPEELEFYQSYDWSLNPYLTVGQATSHLLEEIDRLVIVPNDWRRAEVATNIFLLCGGLLNCVEEYLRGPALRLPGRLSATLAARCVNGLIEATSNSRWSRRRVARWRALWITSLDEFLSLIVRRQAVEPADLSQAAHKMSAVLRWSLPCDLQAERLGSPTTFARLDLTHLDFLALGESFVQRFPERSRFIAVIGLRTAGSYFAPLLKAFLKAEGYQYVQFMTIEPNKGISRREKRQLRRFAARDYLALIVDDPPYTNRTVLAALGIAGQAGFAPVNIKFLMATHPAKPAWFKWLPPNSVITLQPEQWHKSKLLHPKAVEHRLQEYFARQNFVKVKVSSEGGAQVFNARLKKLPCDERGVRLKCVFEVQLATAEDEKQIKYVLAKSVGWGWFGYQAFLVGHRIAGHVPPILGLRDGILYLEWLPQLAPASGAKRNELISAVASYIAARVRHLRVSCDKVSSLGLKRYDNGVRLLEKVLSRAYGPLPMNLLMRARLGQKLRERPCPYPTLIDGNMHRNEWVRGATGPVKVDFEHHGLGKGALNLTDPAYDLADTILNLELSAKEECDLITQYVGESGDAGVRQRLFICKLLAGLWAMNEVHGLLFSSPRGGDAQRAYTRRFMNAWHFLTVQTAYYCGSLCQRRSELHWRAPLVALDIDGVLDRRLFGFPCTTAAGIKAISLLNSHDFSVALNTARSASEVREYCKAYSLAGGIAEHGSYLWDAVHRREQVLISAEAGQQLKELKERLQLVPGVFLDERHQHSIRAFSYRDKPLGLIQSLVSSAYSSSVGDGALGPISTQIVHELLVDLNLDRLTFHHSPIDTTIIAKGLDKGTGLVALRDWVLSPNVETIAIGDGEADLAMFRVASRSFAPGNVGCRRQARLLGCNVATGYDQQGLLEIVRNIVHAADEHCAQCSHDGWFGQRDDDLDLSFSVLQAADQRWNSNLLRVVLDPRAYKFFVG
jgi:hydroxymethylpyrimidine pyrophosphatase-like HAD family hydrolase